MRVTRQALWRIAIMATTVVAAVAAGRDAMLAYWRNQAALSYSRGHAPQRMPGLARLDPDIMVIAAQAASSAGKAEGLEASRTGSVARAALAANPLNPGALHLLALLAEQEKPGSGYPIFVAAEGLSRRDAANEVVLERLKAEAGDVPGALAHVDRIVSAVPDLARPVLGSMAAGLADPVIRGGFARYAARPWFPTLLLTAIEQKVPSAAIAPLVLAAGSVQPPDALAQLRNELLIRSIAEGDQATARLVAGELPREARAVAADMGFPMGATKGGSGILAWRLASDEISHADALERRRLGIGVAGEVVGVVASRVSLLAPGTYEVSQVLTYEEGSPSAVLTWDLVCMGPRQASLWHYVMPARAGSVSYRALLKVPADCPAQQWQLKAAGESSQSESRAVLGPFAVAPIRDVAPVVATPAKAAATTGGQ